MSRARGGGACHSRCLKNKGGGCPAGGRRAAYPSAPAFLPHPCLSYALDPPELADVKRVLGQFAIHVGHLRHIMRYRQYKGFGTLSMGNCFT